MALPVGSTAPDFTLLTKGPDGIVPITLSETLKNGPVALLFVPGAFTSVCTTELCDATGGLGDFAGLGVQVFGVSPDSPFALDAWAKHSHISIPLLSDFKREVTEAYDAVWPDFIGLGPTSARVAILIGQDGIIKFSEQTPTLGDLPDIAGLKTAAAAL